MSITLMIVVVTAIVSIKAFNDPNLVAKFLFKPVRVFHQKEYHRLLSSGLIHADFMHLGINMYVLYIFGEDVESYYGSYIAGGKLTYLALYITALAVSCLPDLKKHKNNPYYSALGASGATSAILFAFIVFNPTRTLYLFMILPLPAWLLGILYVAYSSHMSKKQSDNIGHMAHLSGALYGFIVGGLIQTIVILRFILQLI